jgi:hypothetical protein
MTDVNEKVFDDTFQSVVATPPVEERQQPTAHPIILSVAAASQAITPWGTAPKTRDRELRAFWHTESWLASVVYGVSIRNASFVWEVVGADPAKPEPKNTVRRVERVLKQSDKGRGWKSLITKTCIDLFCLAGSTRIALGGERLGQTKSIRELVRDKDVGPVVSYGIDGKLVENYINEWHTTPLANRRWYWLSAKHASGHSGKRRGGIFITSDHPMLTQRGWVRAEEITTEDKIATSDPVPSWDQAEILVGSLLGDGCIAQLPKRALLRFSHGTDQLDYLEFKKSLFSGFNWTGQKLYTGRWDNSFVGVNSRASLGLVDWHTRWYPEGKKQVNREDVEKYFSPKMLAVWYMDDGTRAHSLTTAGNVCEHGCLSTESFSLVDVAWLANFLSDRGFYCTIDPLYDGKYYRLRFSAEGFRNLSQYIGKYVVPSLRYKLGQYAPEYDDSVWQIESAGIYFDDIEMIEQRDYYSGSKVCQTTYHIGVENTHTFIAGGLVSHNTQDNGAFWELIRLDNNNPLSPVINIAHLDAGQCQRTGDPEYPVIYTDRLGNEHVLRWWQIRTLEEFPSPVETAFNLQYSATSRALLAAEIIQSISVYKMEKVSGSFTKAIDAVSGLTQNDIDDAITLAKEQILNQGMYRYSMPVIVSGIDPSNSLSHVHIDLASLPDNFDEDTSFKWYVAQLAAAFGVDYQEIAPLMTGSLGSSQQSEIMHLKTHGKGPALIMGLLEDIINDGLIPNNVVFRFKEQDLRTESEKAEAKFTRVKSRAMQLKAGEIDPKAARQLAVLEGDLPMWLVDEIDERGEAQPEPITQPVGAETGPDQIEGGSESYQERSRLTPARIQQLREKLKTDPYEFLRIEWELEDALE